MNNDKKILRDLAKKVIEMANKEEQHCRKEMWRNLNSLRKVQRPLIYVNHFMWWDEVFPDNKALVCEEPELREVERYLRMSIFHNALEDDNVIEPWVVVPCVYEGFSDEMRWGVPIRQIHSDDKKGAWMFDFPIKEINDIKKLIRPRHIINEEATCVKLEKVRDAIGDVMPAILDRGPLLRIHKASITNDLARLRGLENIFYDMVDNPEWLKKILSFMCESILGVYDEAEKNGDLKLINHYNQSIPYCYELSDPDLNDRPVTRGELWGFFEAQEFTLVSPEMTHEFAIKYQKELMKHYGLIAYGCCEGLTNKISYLKDIPNLRRIAISPWADVEKCVEQIGNDYVISWRPNPVTLCSSFDPEYLDRYLRENLEKMKGCFVEINLKDIKTIQNDIHRLKEWVKIAKRVSEDFGQ